MSNEELTAAAAPEPEHGGASAPPSDEILRPSMGYILKEIVRYVGYYLLTAAILAAIIHFSS